MNVKRTDSQTIGVRVRPDVVEALRKQGDLEFRTMSSMAGKALEDWCLARRLIKREKPFAPAPALAGP